MDEFMMEEACGGNVTCESTGEYTLPDYMPEVRRVLRVDADASVTGTYENGDKTETGGETRYTVIYSDAEGQLAAAELDGTFEGSIHTSGSTGMTVYPRVENVACRLMGPRRLSLRAGVALHAEASRAVPVSMPKVDENAGKVELLTCPVRVSTTQYFAVPDIALTDSVKAEENLQVLSSDGRVLVRDVKCEEDGVRIRGEVWLTALCNHSAGNPCTLSTKIPFEEHVDCDGVMPGFTGIAWACLRHVSCEMGESGTAIFDVNFAISGMATKHEEGRATTDLYSTQFEMTPLTERITGRWYPIMQMANFTVDGNVPREELGGGDEPLRPVDARAVVTSAHCTTDGAVVVLEGDIRVGCILSCDASEGGYRSENFSIPYKVRVNCGENIPENCTIHADVVCISCRTRPDGNRLGVDAEIGVTVVGTCEEQVDVITSATCDMSTAVTHAEDEIIAAYLSDGDTLWSIGKRYHVPLADIASANSLPDEAMETPDFAQHLDGLSRLMII